jgi:hypothetical protein
MNNYALFAEAIFERVDMSIAVRQYGITLNRAGFALCPFHSEKSPSFTVHQNRGRCFGCGWHGSIIDFVRSMYGLTFTAAIEKLNADFILGLPVDRRPTLREQRDAQRRHEQIMQQRAAEDAARQAYDEQYWQLWGEWIRLDRNKREHEWTSYADEPHPLYLEALQKLPHQAYLLDTFMATHPYPGRESVVTINIGRDQYRSGFDRRSYIRNGQQAANQ